MPAILPLDISGIVSSINDQMPRWGVLGVGLAAAVSWIGTIISGVLLAKANGRITATADRAKNEMMQASNIAVARVQAELGQAAETHKLALKKQELLFNKQLDAASAFMALRRTIDPKKAHPFEEWDEAQQRLALDLPKHERALEAFLTEHGPIMPEEARLTLAACVSQISFRRFDYEPGGEIEKDLSEMIDSLLHELSGIELGLLKQVKA